MYNLQIFENDKFGDLTVVIEEFSHSPEEFIKRIEKLKNDKQKLEALKHALDKYTPYIQIGQTLSKSDKSISMGAFAKLLNREGINIGRNRLYQWFRDNGYIMKQGNENQPIQKYIDQGLLTIKEFVVTMDECKDIRITTYITGKGQVYFLNKIMGDVKYEDIYKYN